MTTQPQPWDIETRPCGVARYTCSRCGVVGSWSGTEADAIVRAIEHVEREHPGAPLPALSVVGETVCVTSWTLRLNVSEEAAARIFVDRP